MANNQIISVIFQGIEVGKIGYDEDQRKSSFQYNPAFLEINLHKIFSHTSSEEVQIHKCFQNMKAKLLEVCHQ